MVKRITFRRIAGFSVGICWLLLVAAQAVTPVTVGTKGNEPLVVVAPEGTIYVSALQHIYRSTNGGTSFEKLPGPIYASTLNLASDSSIAVDPGNRLYFTFDYPYAGTTAVCTSDDKGTTFACNPAVVPGGTDRMWIVAPKTNAAYEVTNEGLYETAFLQSSDRGQTFVPKAVGSGLFEPQTGPLLQGRCSKFVLQPIKIYGNGPADEEVKLYVYDPTAAGSVTSDIRGTGLKLPTALPSASFSRDDILFAASEEANAAGGREVIVARSADEGLHWTKLPPIPATANGTATFSWVAAGEPGHVGVVYYYTPDNGDPGTLTKSTWNAVFAETFNANTAAPTWTVTSLETGIHTGAICVAADCMGTNRFSGDFINAVIDSKGAAHAVWMKQDATTAATSVRYAKIETIPGSGSSFSPPPCNTPSPSPTPAGSPTPTPTPSPTPSASPSPTPTATPADVRLLNIAGRSAVQTRDEIGIGGFIVQGPGLKRVIVRGIGPSIRVDGQPVPGALQDPTLELRDARGGTVTNDNWRTSQEAEISQTGLAPKDDRESAIVISLPEGLYTAILRGAGESTGIGVVEIYDLAPGSGNQLGNLAVRANVQTDDNVLIEGLIVRGGTPKRILFRGIGPELRDAGVTGELSDPVLELRDANGVLLVKNDSWRSAPNAAEIEATGMAPKDDRESAILMTLSAGTYTAILNGANRSTGIAIAEAYKLN